MIRYIFHVVCFLSLIACSGHKAVDRPQSDVITKTVYVDRPVESMNSLEMQAAGELHVIRVGNLATASLAFIAAIALFSLGLTRFALMAAGCSAAAVGNYIALLFVTFALPWIPYALLALVLTALVLVAIWAVKHHVGISKALAAKFDPSILSALSNPAQAFVKREIEKAL